VSLPPLVEPAESLTVDEVRRYSRHLIIPDVGMAGQKRLKNAKVLCVGAGGLGSPALMYLAAAGVGTLGILEFDFVDESNLQRQIIHGQSDIGRPKGESARDFVKEINPYVQVNLHPERLDSSNVFAIFSQYDLIVDGTDNFATRYLVNDACVLLGKPYVWGSIYRFDGSGQRVLGRARPLLPLPLPRAAAARDGAVVRRGRRSRRAVRVDRVDPGQRGDQADHRHRRDPARAPDGLRRSRDDVPPGEDPQGPELRRVRGEPDGHRAHRTTRRSCRHQSRRRRPRRPRTRRSPSFSYKEMLDAREAGEIDFVLIDVREPNEFEIVSIEGAVLIPKGEILDGSALEQLPNDKQIVLHCKVGGRSAEALAVVKGAGFSDAIHVGGGILAWVHQIEPDKPSY